MSKLDEVIDTLSREKWSKAIKAKFPKDNKIVYWQDFRLHTGMPSNVEFEMLFSSPDKSFVVCRAPGYGVAGDYGNGKIVIYKGDQK